MSARKNPAGSATVRHGRVRIAPIAHAVRVALAASATALVLSASGAALAGTCTTDGDNIVHCNGDFTSTINYFDADLSLVLGDTAPTSVTPAASYHGVFAYGTDTVSVVSGADISTSDGDGIVAFGWNSASVDNSGDISAVGTGYGSTSGVLAVGVYTGATVDVHNAGGIDVSSPGDAFGVYAYSNGDATIGNDGDIGATSTYGIADAIFATASGTVGVDNSGRLEASGGYWAAGIEAQGDDLTTVTNTGSITATGTGGYSHAYGVYATGGAGGVVVHNDGDITVMGPYATGIEVASHGSSGAIDISNGGDITVGAVDATYYANGIHAASNDALSDITVDNSGSIVADSYFGSNGIAIAATGAGSNASVGNSGAITVDTYGNYASIGIAVSADNNAGIDNSGSITILNGGNSYGALALAFNGTADISNSGDITVDSASLAGYAYGVIASSQNGAGHVDNSGTITVGAGNYGAILDVGIVASGTTDAAVDNSGAITAMGVYAYGIEAIAGQGDATIDNAAGGVVQAISVFYTATAVAGISTAGDVSVNNAGDIAALSAYDAIGALSLARDGDAAIDNSGTVLAYSAYANAIGTFARASGGAATVSNGGDIAAYSAYSNAVGIYGNGLAGATVSIGNSGGIIAAAGTAYGASTGSAFGVRAIGASVLVGNDGDIDATAYANAIGILAQGDVSAAVDNTGSIQATNLHGYGSQAAGVYAVSSGGTVAVANSGDIDAQASVGQVAFGVAALGYGDVLVENAGSISAGGDGAAAAVLLDSTTAVATLHNTGVIQGPVAVLGLDGVQHIQNEGQLFGALVTNGGDDVFDNLAGGVWGVANQGTDLGDGDDAIHNLAGGVIAMDNAAISLGASGANGNVFDNAGVLGISGDNLIDMGDGAHALANEGVISFLDGFTDDSLTITGDLGGSGALDIDVDFTNGSSDQLFVDGSMADGAAQSVNVVVDTLPLQSLTTVPFAQVTGDSSAGSFVGGEVSGLGSNGFLDFQVGVTSQLDATNATADVFSLGLQVAGLSDAGTLAASIASGAQGLATSQIGTYRQRMGVMPARDPNKSGISPWLRAYASSGDVDPAHVADNFAQGGDFAYSQSNHGYELGVDVDVAGPWHVGVLFNRGQGNQRLQSGGGSDHLSARTFGVYGTWLAPDFYVDASYRWMGFDADLRSSMGTLRVRDGGVESVNVEAGWNAWTSGSGLQLTPQVQYTRTRVSDMPVLRDNLTTFAPQGGVSERGRVGIALADTFTGGHWTWTPYGSVNAVREFDGRMDYVIGDRFTGSTRTEGTSALLELGLGAQSGGFAATAGVDWSDGGALDSVLGGQLVLRYTW